MTIREFLKVIDGDKGIRVCEQGDEILKIDTRYIKNVKEELLDREIEEHGVAIYNNYNICIFLEKKGEENEN